MTGRLKIALMAVGPANASRPSRNAMNTLAQTHVTGVRVYAFMR